MGDPKPIINADDATLKGSRQSQADDRTSKPSSVSAASEHFTYHRSEKNNAKTTRISECQGHKFASYLITCLCTSFCTQNMCPKTM